MSFHSLGLQRGDFSGVLDPDFDFMFGARDKIDFSFQEEPYRGPYNHNGSVNGPTVRGTQVNHGTPIGKTMSMGRVRQ
jgi:hypothetical protein|tara:strand:- start:4479 stop:4712 length:234 start_codon:yes stop_codon:yes gene_type:complete